MGGNSSHQETTGNQIRANCGVTREGDGRAKISYKVGNRSSVKWNVTKNESGYIATMNAREPGGDSRYHESNIIPEDVYRQLGKAKGELRGDYYIVTMTCPSNVDIERYFS